MKKQYFKVRKDLEEFLSKVDKGQSTGHVVSKLDAVWEDYSAQIAKYPAETLARLLVESGSGLKRDAHPFLS